MHEDSHYAGLWIAVRQGQKQWSIFTAGHLRKWLKRIEDIDEEKKEKKIKSLIVRKKIGQNCRLSINKRESFLNADKNTLNAKSLFYSRFTY